MDQAIALVLVVLVVVVLLSWLQRTPSRPSQSLPAHTVRRIRERSLAPRPVPAHVHRLQERLRLEDDLEDDEVDRRVAVVLSWCSVELTVLDDGERAVTALVAAAKQARTARAGPVPAPMSPHVQLDARELDATVRGVVDEVLGERSAVPTGYAAGFADGHRAVGDVLRARCELIAARRRKATRSLVARLEAIESFNARRAAVLETAQQADDLAGAVAAAVDEALPALTAPGSSERGDLGPEVRRDDLRAISRTWIRRELTALEETVTRWRANLAGVLSTLPDPVPEPVRSYRPLDGSVVRDLEEVLVDPPATGGSGTDLTAYDFAYRGVLERLHRRIDTIASGSGGGPHTPRSRS